MKTLLLMLALAGVARAAIPEGYGTALCEAIWHAEGGSKAKVPYGVLSVPVRDAAHARAICLNTVRRSWDRWYRAGCSGDFIEHLGATYCPIKGDTTGLNRHWVRNVRARLPRPRVFYVN